MYRSRVSSVLESLSLVLSLSVLFLVKVCALEGSRERAFVGGTVGKKNESSKSNNNERALSLLSLLNLCSVGVVFVVVYKTDRCVYHVCSLLFSFIEKTRIKVTTE